MNPLKSWWIFRNAFIFFLCTQQTFQFESKQKEVLWSDHETHLMKIQKLLCKIWLKMYFFPRHFGGFFGRENLCLHGSHNFYILKRPDNTHNLKSQQFSGRLCRSKYKKTKMGGKHISTAHVKNPPFIWWNKKTYENTNDAHLVRSHVHQHSVNSTEKECQKIAIKAAL